MLRVLGIIAIVIGVVTMLMLAYLSCTGYSTFITRTFHRAPPSMCTARITRSGKAIAVAVSDTVYVRKRVEGYRYTATVYTYTSDMRIRGMTIKKAETYLLSAQDFNTYIEGVLLAYRAGTVSLSELRSALRKTALDYSPMRNAWGTAKYVAEELDIGSESEVLAVVIVEYDLIGARVVLPGGSVVVLNPTVLRTLNLSLIPPIIVPVWIEVTARLNPSLEQYMRCLDLVVVGALLIAADLLSRGKLRAWARK